MRRGSFSQAAIGQGAAALNRVFERYMVPITFSSEQLHLHMSYNDVDAAASPIWYDDDGAVLAAALLAIRGKRAWIGGFGVAPEYRGRGIAMELLDTLKATARERGVETMQLEVLSGNAAALAAYRGGGFEITRTLRSFERFIDTPAKPANLVTAGPQDYIDLPDDVRPCWQRERRTLQSGAVSTAASDGNGNYALFRYNAQAAQVLKIAAADAQMLDALAHAVASGREFQNVMLLNEPEESRIVEYARTAHWSEPFVQYEMMLRL